MPCAASPLTPLVVEPELVSDVKSAWQLSTAVECLTAETMMNARATASVTATPIALRRWLRWCQHSSQTHARSRRDSLLPEDLGVVAVDAEEAHELQDGHEEAERAEDVGTPARQGDRDDCTARLSLASSVRWELARDSLSGVAKVKMPAANAITANCAKMA